jgi:hypothetical protein
MSHRHDAPWIVDEASYGTHFKAVGYPSCLCPQPCYETNDAVVAGERILRELQAQGRELSVGY